MTKKNKNRGNYHAKQRDACKKQLVSNRIYNKKGACKQVAGLKGRCYVKAISFKDGYKIPCSQAHNINQCKAQNQQSRSWLPWQPQGTDIPWSLGSIKINKQIHRKA